jgi:hypothetical protein
MKVYKRRNGKHVNATVEVLEIFSSPLQKITPETMGFQITDLIVNPWPDR